MAKSVAISGYKKGDRLHFPNRHKIDAFAKRIADGSTVHLEIREDDTHLIDSDRKFYHAVVVPECCKALNECGYSVDFRKESDREIVHEWLKKEFLRNEITLQNREGESIKMPSSTKRLDSDGWKAYLKDIFLFAAEMWGYCIPPKTPKYYFPTDSSDFDYYNNILQGRNF